jgi:adenosylcobinamide kinase/adenosylcobinamide-phosphate guanylyltransferase
VSRRSPPPLVFVLGGARSGKSRFALERASSLAAPRRFVATGEARDAEMAERIARHRAERGEGWQTVEEPRAITDVLRRAKDGVSVVDCLTLWLANVMGDRVDADVTPQLDGLVAALEARRAAIVVVSNEVGLGIVPDHPLGRAFRDAAGIMNRRVAAVADEMHFLVAGQALRFK